MAGAFFVRSSTMRPDNQHHANDWGDNPQAWGGNIQEWGGEAEGGGGEVLAWGTDAGRGARYESDTQRRVYRTQPYEWAGGGARRRVGARATPPLMTKEVFL